MSKTKMQQTYKKKDLDDYEIEVEVEEDVKAEDGTVRKVINMVEFSYQFVLSSISPFSFPLLP